MPELPEVETTKRGVAPHLENQTIQQLVIRNRNLRWPVTSTLKTKTKNQQILSVRRRAKYLLIEIPTGTILIHLGMSGSLRILPANTPAEKHDHIDLILLNGTLLRYRDPRRFGAWLWQPKHTAHVRLEHLGPEPLSRQFTAAYLFASCHGKRRAIKLQIMDNAIVVGVGNIYANEALFRAGIHPEREADSLFKDDCQALSQAIKAVLKKAIAAGGTTLKDFQQVDGKPGYFRHKLQVYDRENEPCYTCQTVIKKTTQGQRATYFCKHCQS